MQPMPPDPRFHQARAITRRTLLHRGGLGLGAAALDALLAADGHGAPPAANPGTERRGPLAPRKPMIPAKAKAVIYLHMSGAPPTLDLYDDKPKLRELDRQPCPESLIQGRTFAFIKGRPLILGSPHPYARVGSNGWTMSSQIPHIGGIADEICLIKSVHTDQFNHAPAEMFLYTGAAFPGNASMGSWITWGLGTENQNLPGFVVLVSGGTDPTGGKSLWSSGFLPSVHQGVQCRTSGDPILYLSDPAGMDRASRRRSLDALERINREEAVRTGDPETLTRIEQYELAFRMQMSVPEATDISKETQETLDLYGVKPGESGFARNVLLARRLVERGVRYVQLYDWGWDIHGTGPGDDLMSAFPSKCRQVDRASAALILDLKRRGMLDDVLVVWGGEFGRTPMNEARDGSKSLGRDHHPHSFALWMAGGGVKSGFSYGETDELGWGIAKDPVSIRDLQATILHQMGLDPFRLRHRYQGLEQRLIGPTDEARVLKSLLS